MQGYSFECKGETVNLRKRVTVHNQQIRDPRTRWMDELGFYVPSTVFQSFRDDGRVNMKGSVQ